MADNDSQLDAEFFERLARRRLADKTHGLSDGRVIEVDVTAKPVEGQPGVYTADVPALATMGDITVINPIFPGESQ